MVDPFVFYNFEDGSIHGLQRMEENEYTMAGKKLQSWWFRVFPTVEMGQEQISDSYETYRRWVETILIRDGRVPTPLPNYEEDVDPLIELTEAEILDRFPPLTIEEGEIVEDLITNERDWYAEMQSAMREPCRRNNRVLPETVQDFITQIGTWMAQDKTEATDSVLLQKLEDVLKTHKWDIQTANANIVKYKQDLQASSKTVEALHKKLARTEDLLREA